MGGWGYCGNNRHSLEHPKRQEIKQSWASLEIVNSEACSSLCVIQLPSSCLFAFLLPVSFPRFVWTYGTYTNYNEEKPQPQILCPISQSPRSVQIAKRKIPLSFWWWIHCPWFSNSSLNLLAIVDKTLWNYVLFFHLKKIIDFPPAAPLNSGIQVRTRIRMLMFNEAPNWFSRSLHPPPFQNPFLNCRKVEATFLKLPQIIWIVKDDFESNRLHLVSYWYVEMIECLDYWHSKK